MAKKQHYMMWEERCQLEALLRARIPKAEIARQMGFSRQTIYNELRRGTYIHTLSSLKKEPRYSAHKAQQKHDYMQSGKGRPLKIGIDKDYADRLEALMLGKLPNGKTDRRRRYSPAAALAQTRREGYITSVCIVTLYSYISKGVFRHVTNKNLWVKGQRKKQQKNKVQRIAHPALPIITQRPEYINDRSELGHTEMDLIVSCEKGSGALLTLTERVGRTEYIRKLPNKKAESVRSALRSIREEMPELRSITTDNGPEFLEYAKLIDTVQCPVYYCHSYAAWEKGSNECHNRMIRRWYPKGTNFAKVSAKDSLCH